MYTEYIINDENVNDYQKQAKILQTIKSRFHTYGYKQIKTPAFERYDLYSTVTSSINQQEMIKVIDYTGDVLVLRPDVTIPIARQVAEDVAELTSERRYFYIQDVYRQPFERGESIESTQAGVEYFGKSTPEADAEVIALACQLLTDLGFTDVKIELGHAGFFQEIIEMIDLTANDLAELKKMIQAKSAVDIGPFLKSLSVSEEIAAIIETIPFLYGNLVDVSKRTREIKLTDKMKEKLNYLEKVYRILKMYGIENQVVIDLGLINHMGYYSDIIFQGFVDRIGQPVLMGGRYDQLANAFGSQIPAIGFACQVKTLVQAIAESTVVKPVDFIIQSDQESLPGVIAIANALRRLNYSVLTEGTEQESTYLLTLQGDKKELHYQDEIVAFSGIDDLLDKIERRS